MNKTVINGVLPWLLPQASHQCCAAPSPSPPRVVDGPPPPLQIASGSAAEPSVIDLFDALGGANLTQARGRGGCCRCRGMHAHRRPCLHSQPNITCDGCHPVDAGYVEMAHVIYGVRRPPPLFPPLGLSPPFWPRAQVIESLRTTEKTHWPAPDAAASPEQLLVSGSDSPTSPSVAPPRCRCPPAGGRAAPRVEHPPPRALLAPPRRRPRPVRSGA